jgi:hypothetical protein
MFECCRERKKPYYYRKSKMWSNQFIFLKYLICFYLHNLKCAFIKGKAKFAKAATQILCRFCVKFLKIYVFLGKTKHFVPTHTTQEAEACRDSSAHIPSSSRRSRSSIWGRGSLSARRRGRGSLSAWRRGSWRRRVRQHEGEDGQLQRATSASPQTCLQQVRVMFFNF